MKRVPRFLEKRNYSGPANMSAPGFTASMTVPSIAGILVTPQTALTFTAYYAGIRVITEDAASLPYVTFQKQRGGGAKGEWGHPVSTLFNRSPDGECNDLNWRESYYSHVLGWGNAYSEIEWDRYGWPLKLHMLHPSIVMAKRTRDGQLFYELQNAVGANAGTKNRQLAPWRVMHLAGLGFNGLVGYSPVTLCREAIGLGKAAEQFGASLFGNGAIPKGILEFPGRMKDEARKNLRETFNLAHQGSAAANKIALLEEGVHWVATQIPPEDAQFLASRQFQVVEMARILRLPPHKIGDFSQAHLANIEAANDDYIISCLRPWTLRLEKTVDFKLLTNEEWLAGFYTKHDFRPLLLKLAKDRADYYRKLWEIGIYTVNEIRELEGLNPVTEDEGGSLRFRPVNIMGLTEKSAPKQPDQTDDKAPSGMRELLAA